VPMLSNDVSLEDSALELRQEGLSFAAIAKILGYERGGQEAFGAFKRALRRRSPDERLTLRHQEMDRLISMEEGFRVDPRLTPEERSRCLRAVSALQATLKSL
jgi:hypothetical protein